MNSEQESFLQEILEAKKAGVFLKFIYNASRGDQQNRERIVELLIFLHNDNEIDIVDEFQHLRNRSDSPGDFFNRLEKLSGSLDGKWSVRINKQWRIIFVWQKENAHDVAIVDYH